MAQRKRIGIVFAQDESWAGGFYYTLNIIKSLTFIEERDKPEVIVFIGDRKYEKNIEEIGYPYLKFYPLYPPPSLMDRILNKILKTKKQTPQKYKANIVSFVYPINYFSSYEALKNIRQVYWIPDLQHLHLPQNFTKDQIEFREKRIERVVKNNFDIVFSSHDSKNDFLKAYSKAGNQLHVLNFPSILPLIDKQDALIVKEKFKLEEIFFLCSNQFWKHKNHMQVLQAILLLKQKHKKISIVFTGNMIDHCEKEYVDSLLSFVEKNHLLEYCSFLGYIDRMDQLKLIKASIAVIQPSLFEGWSSIVEDCKALNHHILLSDINVHLEQIKDNCTFFKALDAADLALKMQQTIDNPPLENKGEYSTSIVNFAKGIVNL